MTLALEVYQLVVAFLAHLVPFGSAHERDFAATLLVLTVNAFTHEPLKKWLEHVISHSYKGSVKRRQPR